MGFVKVIKNRAYFKRYQVKFRRRREAKTDYYARKRLIIQDKNKYLTPKYRLVVRFTNKDIICQIVSAGITNDDVVASAYSHELKRYGIQLGLTNYAAAYATGLLLARRVNKKFNLEFYEGVTEPDGEEFLIEADPEENAPFQAVLDVGLRRTTTGARLFGALKGAVDGGLDIPHNSRRFPGTKVDGKDATPDAEFHRKYIFGGHVAEYMNLLKDDNPEAYNKQFSAFIKAGIKADDLEGIYAAAHAAIREDPNKPRDDKALGYFKVRTGAKPEAGKGKRYSQKKISLAQRKGRIKQKLTAAGVESLA